MSCGCEEGEHRKAEPGDVPAFQPSANRYLCQCGCLELRERVAILEQAVYQLGLIIENREKAKGEPAGLDKNDNYIARREEDIKPRWIGDKNAQKAE